MEQGICYIFGAGEVSDCDIELQKHDLVIAADGGYDYATSVGVPVDISIGDFDSLSSSSLPVHRIVHPVEKDDTDTMLSIKYGLDKGYTHFEIYGGLGGRLDHTIANIQSLAYLAHVGARGVLQGNSYALTVIKDSTFTLPAAAGTYFSVFSISDTCSGVSLSGSKYELSDAELTNHFPLGVSNAFQGSEVKIGVKKGTLMILWYLDVLEE